MTRPRSTVWAGVATVAVAAVLAGAFLAGGGQRDAPGLQQLDLLYLDEPAPLLDRVGHRAGRALVVVVCTGCRAPTLAADADVVVTDDAALARAYALLGEDGTPGPGYALVDGGGRLRYRTVDPSLSGNGREVDVLLGGLSRGRAGAAP